MNCWIKFWLAWRQCPAHISPYKILFSSLQLTFSCNLLLHDLTHDECIEICKEHLHSFYPTSSRCVFSSGVGFSSSISFSHYARQLELECQLEYRTLDRKWLNYSKINKFKFKRTAHWIKWLDYSGINKCKDLSIRQLE